MSLLPCERQALATDPERFLWVNGMAGYPYPRTPVPADGPAAAATEPTPAEPGAPATEATDEPEPTEADESGSAAADAPAGPVTEPEPVSEPSSTPAPYGTPYCGDQDGTFICNATKSHEDDHAAWGIPGTGGERKVLHAWPQDAGSEASE